MKTLLQRSLQALLLLVLVLQSFQMGLQPARVAGGVIASPANGGFVTYICTAHGIQRIVLPVEGGTDEPSQPSPDESTYCPACTSHLDQANCLPSETILREIAWPLADVGFNRNTDDAMPSPERRHASVRAPPAA